MKKWIYASLGTLLIGCASQAQTLVDSTLTFNTVISSGISIPIAIEFLSPDDPNRFFLIEKNTGLVKLVQNGAVASTVLDVPVNYDSERGLIGITLDPNFAQNGYVYLYYTRSSTGADTNVRANWLDNRVERYTWNGTSLTDPLTLFRFLSDASQNNGPNHDGGIILFGPDNKLYGVTGDLNRGFFSNPRIEQNTSTTAVAGVGGIFRVNPNDGSPVFDNPFITHANLSIKRLFAYGVRNSFGMTFDPLTGKLWQTENGPDKYDEINLVERGFNSGWLKIMGPDSRNATYGENGNTAYNANQLTSINANAFYADPKFSWLAPIGVTSITFLRSARFNTGTRDQVVVGESNFGGLYFFSMNTNRNGFNLTGDLADLVADSITERNLSRWGTSWGVVTDLKIGPDGYLYVVSAYSNRVARIRPISPPTILQGKARLQNPNANLLGRAVQIQLKQGETVVQTINTTLDAFGRISERVNTAGTYDLVVKTAPYLSIKIPDVTFTNGGFAYREFVPTLAGDVNGDNAINDEDLLLVIFAFGLSGIQAADLNLDGSVNDEDLLILLFNFGLLGEE